MAFPLLSSPRAYLRAVPHSRVNIYRLHYRGLSGGGLLLHLFKT